MRPCVCAAAFAVCQTPDTATARAASQPARLSECRVRWQRRIEGNNREGGSKSASDPTDDPWSLRLLALKQPQPYYNMM